ncbi:MAG: GNAT family N-acetyltransferase [Oscillospiraceae bacterium]|jgi:GNAT superfamily N-acetyltransferase|nr:GNAT family N-acetyltransferase [Oscillospiraceae bacterium]
MLDLRTARESDDLRPLWNTAFEADEAFFTRDYRPERALIYTGGGKPVSMLHMLPRTVITGGRRLRAGYLMGIATDPAYRRRGLAGNLITAALKAFEEDHCDCAFLIPASAALAVYYGKFGFTVRGLTAHTGGGRFSRPAGTGDSPRLRELYDGAFPDRAERDAFEWETILLEYEVFFGEDGYAAGDGRGVLERVPSGFTESGCAACIKPFTAQTAELLARHRPYINLLYT